MGETRKLVTEKEGILINLTSEEISNAIYKLMNENELCKKLGKNARIKATSEHNIEKFSEYFYKITA